MSGWKTWLAAGLSIVYGVGGWLVDLHGTDVMMGFVAAGLGLIGIGHKLDRVAK